MPIYLLEYNPNICDANLLSFYSLTVSNNK